MRYKKLGGSTLTVSELCLGTMTWGTQNTAPEAFNQIDYCLDHGLNFIDTAEMYPVNPLSKQTQGDSERILGQWIKQSGRRDEIVVATKVSGAGYQNVRDGAPISAATMREAVESSLKRLETDVIDLYQLHWPNRGSYHFRKSWTYDPTGQDRNEVRAHIHEVLTAADQLVREGKIRYLGLSNESCWGTGQFLQIADQEALPRCISIQNEYSLMCRHFDLDLAELCHNEQVDLLAFSPLATGLLTEKYVGGALPEGSRRTFVSNLGGRYNERSDAVVTAYGDIARKYGLVPAQMALAFCRTRPFMGSIIFGSTTMEQLKIAIGSTNVTLDDVLLEEIGSVHRQYPIPF